MLDEGNVSATDPVVIASMITVVGMVFVAACSGLVQWSVTKRLISSEADRVKLQLKSEFNLRQFETWRAGLQGAVAELLALTDFEASPTLDSQKIARLILKIELMLDTDIESHSHIGSLISEIGLHTNGWREGSDVNDVMCLQTALLNAVRRATHLSVE